MSPPAGHEATHRGVQIRAATAADASAILRAHARAFAAVDPHFRPRTLDDWRWAFEACPAGWQAVIAVDPRGEVLAHYAGVRQRLRWGERTLHASQAVDTFLSPEALRLGRRSWLARVGELYAELHGAPDRDAFMWGLPVPRALRVGRAQLGYEVVRTLDQLAAAPEGLPQTGPLEVEELEALPPEVELLAAHCVRERGLTAERDRAWLDWRYLRRPNVRYAIALARDRAGAAGLVVTREGSFDGERATLVCEWLVPCDRGDAAQTLLAWCARRARAERSGRVALLVPDTTPAWLRLQDLGLRVRPSSYSLVARSYTRALDRERLRRDWWWTLGDTDLV